MRNVPVLQQYYEKKASAPRCMALGFAAYLLFMKSEKTGTTFTGHAGAKPYAINDDKAAELHELWNTGNTNNFVQKVLEHTGLWGVNLDALPGLREAIIAALETIQQKGIHAALQQVAVPEKI